MKKNKIQKQGIVKFGKETKEIVHNFDVDMDDATAAVFVEWARERILNDKDTLINYAINGILREQMERMDKMTDEEKEKIYGKSKCNSRRVRKVSNRK